MITDATSVLTRTQEIAVPATSPEPRRDIAERKPVNVSHAMPIEATKNAARAARGQWAKPFCHAVSVV